ncbi:MAG: hypothetical protein [Caudoviricetes sp.]|nr:MAG: hypothetical protein [Caudoviricetes sp.]
MMKNNFSFYELKQNIKEQLPLLKYTNSYSNFGTQIYQHNSNHNISISLESFYGDTDIEYIPSGTSKVKCTNFYLDNEKNMHISLEKEVALHGFSHVPFVIQSIINETCDDVSYDEFIDLLIETTNCKVENNDYNDNINIIFPLKNKNHTMDMVIYKRNNIPKRIKTMYQKSGSSSWYNIFDTHIYNDDFNNYYNTKNMRFCTKSGINLSTIYKIINEIYNNIEQEVPVRPRRKDCNEFFGYYLEENDIKGGI